MNQADVKVSFYLKKSEADATGDGLFTRTIGSEYQYRYVR